MNFRLIAATAAAALCLAASAGAAPPAPAPSAPSSASKIIDDAIADDRRPDVDRERDALRKPAETLAFSGVKPGDVVAEIFPGGGYFTRLLSDVVGPKGKVYALETTRWGQSNIDDTKAVLSEKGRTNVRFSATPFGQFSLPEKVDVFWITQNYHDLHVAKYGVVDMAKFNKHVFNSLKHGGVYFIVDHAAKPGTTDDEIVTLHRIDEDVVKKEVLAAGFKLAREADFLRNPDDDRAKRVFDPAIRGKTDRFVLKFVKP
jgi:predicted methyltransferase